MENHNNDIGLVGLRILLATRDEYDESIEKIKNYMIFKKSFLLFSAISGSECDKQGLDITKITLPKRSTKGSAGYDIYSNENVTLKPGESHIFKTGITALMSDDVVLIIAPRSGLGFKYHCALANTIGVIDSDYFYSDNEGHIMVKIVNNGDKPMEITEGMAFCQAICLPYIKAEDDAVTSIRNGGMGSTDSKK